MSRNYPDWKRYIYIWKDKGEIVGLVNSESPDENVFIHIHPNYNYLEEELIQWAENNIGKQKIIVWSLVNDTNRNSILKGKGYKKLKVNEYLNWCNLKRYNPNIKIPEGFEVKSFRDVVDLNSKIECASKAFKSDKVPIEVYRYMQNAPSYKPELDLNIVNNKGKVVSLCTIWFDKENNIGYFEPVATHPDYQRKGFGKAILNEGIRRLKKMSVKTAYVGAHGDNRMAFYNASGFTERVLIKPWRKYK